MVTCTSCGSQVAGAGRFCSSCGAVVSGSASDELATMEYLDSKPRPSGRASSGPGAKTPSSKNPSSSGGLLTEGRFLPGRLLAGRYRIIALLGRGGMGEVYRADDLTLGQPVALKFLPEEASRDEGLVERFRNEVRLSRRVSHPNVCRVYDVGEVDGHTFFTMEYVDGEDLASLLRRIGRLPADKALEIARQLCAGLAAAHAKGVLHRDLKPANIMLDGRGQVVVTDFGLAGLADQIPGSDVRSGTPAYMAPEQLEGREVSVKTDVYSLGLVLYEIFTGKRAFSVESLPELVRVRSESAPSKPSTLVKDLDPAVERVILRCLEADPANRMSSVLSVAAALPGGDPLAAALAAGETPSPQMVAAAGETTGLRPRTAVLCLAAALFGLGLVAYLAIRTSGMGKLGLEQSPEVLTQEAKEIVSQLGYTDKPADTAVDFSFDKDFLDYAGKNDKPRPQWDAVLSGQPSPMQFVYRQSPQYMVATDFNDTTLTPGIVTDDSPPPVLSGMVNLTLDPRGRLTFFQAIPPQVQSDGSGTHAQAVDWTVLFHAAGLDAAQFKPTQPLWTSLATSDTRAAWSGTWPGSSRPLRVEAASLEGKPVFFSLIGAWTRPQRMKPGSSTTPGQRTANMILLVMVVLMVAGAALLARRNYIRGRGDRRGAFRLALVLFATLIGLWLCRGHMIPGLQMLFLFTIAISTALFFSGLIWLLYLSLEPYVRRHWPQALVSWSRVVMGRLNDPLVGRDVLFGVILGVVWLLIFEVSQVLTMGKGAAPQFFSTSYLLGGRHVLGAFLFQIPDSIEATLIFFFLLFVLRVLLRKEWLAAVVFVAIWVTLKTLGSDYPWIEGFANATLYGGATIVVFRSGFVTLGVGIFTTELLGNAPITLDFSAWYFSSAWLPVLGFAALAVWGFYNALAGQKLWQADLFG
ncbi:MAG TPA: protein kinase [Terriglobales bacterium]|nr:protein kinase [Terriglobales bacterium]